LDDKREECGVCAVDSPGKNAVPMLYQMLNDLQHRGQAGAGISTFNDARKIIIRTYKGAGKVPEVFKQADEDEFRSIFEKLGGPKGIGHTRYGTSGALSLRHVQPFERVHGIKTKWFSFGFNGHIANRAELERSVEKMGFHLMLDTDTEVLMHMISRYISESSGDDITEVFRRMASEFDGAYNITLLDATGNLVAIRDPWGIRPLSAINTPQGGFVASETTALYRFGTQGIRHIQPGEIAILKGGEITYERYAPVKRRSLCFFEFLYFASVTSEIDGKSVYEVRKRCGEELAKIETEPINEKDWVIIPVPNTSRPYANTYAKALGMSMIYDEGLIAVGKGRTFIDEGDRRAKVMNKFLPIPSVLKGKKVIVVDDSIVRSTTMATLVKYQLKELGGAKEVHVRIATPPIIAPCYYGIDLRSFEELIASRYQDRIHGGVMDESAQSDIADRIDADSLVYQTHQGLLNALEMTRDELCMACLDRNYPTEGGRACDAASFSRYCQGLDGPRSGCS
jgi:amidophosphoribosyltransferase